MSLGVFPVDPETHPTFADRFGVEHKGTDIFAPRDTAVFAVTSGTVRNATDPKGGTVVYLKGDDGRSYYYAHLSHWSSDETPRKVEEGELVGYVGTTGNAATKAPHLHFEIHTASGPIDPFPELVAFASKTGPSVPIPTSSSSSSWWWLLALFLLAKR